MQSIKIISCTNRPDSNTFKVSRIYAAILKSLNCEVSVFSLTELPADFLNTELYGKRSDAFAKMITGTVNANEHFIFITPEYNGSFPGVLKSFLDAIHPKEWTNKNAAIVGVSNGRAGNIRGMDHLTGILQYLKLNVFYNRLPISSIEKLIDSNGNFISEEQQMVCRAQMEAYLHFISGRK